jgi:glycine/D-amino acid oxidase-like deaminating enzyme
MRAAHGDADWYTASAVRAHTLWLELEHSTGTHIWDGVGLAWLARRADGFEATSVPVLERHGVAHEWLTPDAAQNLFPSLAIDDLHGVLFEPDAGVLHARRATQLLVAEGERRGVNLQGGRVTPADAPATDVVVWACGAWLPQLFPEHVAVEISRRDVFFLGGDRSWLGAPGFVDYDGGFYGHGDVGGLGVKIAPDSTDDIVDPDTLDRIPSASSEQTARAYAASRFPSLAGAPVLGGRVCQYDLSSDTHFIADKHPEHDRWWLVGGGSGHSFKHGPALAEYVADCIEGTREREPFHALGPRAGDAGLRTGSG